MPPAYSGLKLSDKEIDTLGPGSSKARKWQRHWSFIPPLRSAALRLRTSWPRNPIDNFVLAELEKEGSAAQSPKRAKTTLIRRVRPSILPGCHPLPQRWTPSFSDSSPNAWEKVVDRLLASPSYGEQMAIRWLDAARYADTNGYQTDGERHMWRWRDWVIDAFNSNMPFNQLRCRTDRRRPAAERDARSEDRDGFNRNHRGNSEGGLSRKSTRWNMSWIASTRCPRCSWA